MGDRAVYLYAVSRGLRSEDVQDVAGLRDGELRIVDDAGLSAVVSDVDLDEFGDEGLRRNLEDLSWLEQVARVHDGVIQAVADRGVVAPMRLATVFLSDASVGERLRERGQALRRALDRVDGRMEWSVKVYISTDQASPAAGEDAAEGRRSGDGGAGTAYLMRRRREMTRHEDALEAAAALGDSVHTELAGEVVASRRLPPQDRRLTGHEGTMVLNGAYLVDGSRAEDWRATVGRMVEDHPGARIELQGPWPPYSFATLEGVG